MKLPSASQVEDRQSALLGPKLAALFFAAGDAGVNGKVGLSSRSYSSSGVIYMSYPYKWPEIYGFHWG